MKNKILLLLFITAISFYSCDETEDVIYDNQNGQSLASFTNATSNLEVILEDEGSVTIEVGVSTASTTDRTITVEIDESSTAAAENYTLLNNEVIIPAGEYTGTVTIQGIDNSVETAKETIVLNIVSVDGGIATEAQHVVNIFQICPIGENQFIGEYMLEQLTDINPLDGVNVFEDQIVTLSTVEGSTTSRKFSAVYLEGLGIGQAASVVPFELACEDVIVAEGITTGLSCGETPAITLGPADTPATFDINDDSEFELTLTEYVTDGGCDAPPYQVTFKLTKI